MNNLNKLVKTMEFWTSEYWTFNTFKIWINLFLILFIAISFSLFFYFKIRNKKENETPTGFILLVELLLIQIQNIVVKTLGKKYKKISSYILFLIFYINLGNILAIIGLSSPLSNITVVLSLGFITFMGIIFFGFMFKKARFFVSVLFNPIELISLFTSFLSISFRLFGNILAGSIILMLAYSFFASVDNVFSLIFFVPLHIYFDFLIGILHSIIFSILTLTYWSLQRGTEEKIIK